MGNCPGNGDSAGEGRDGRQRSKGKTRRAIELNQRSLAVHEFVSDFSAAHSVLIERKSKGKKSKGKSNAKRGGDCRVGIALYKNKKPWCPMGLTSYLGWCTKSDK